MTTVSASTLCVKYLGRVLQEAAHCVRHCVGACSLLVDLRQAKRILSSLRLLRIRLLRVEHGVLGALIDFVTVRRGVGWAYGGVATHGIFVEVLSTTVSNEAIRVGDLQIGSFVVGWAHRVRSSDLEILNLLFTLLFLDLALLLG